MKNSYIYKTPIGKIKISDNGKRVIQITTKLDFEKEDNIGETDLIKKAYNQLTEYFDGKRDKFDLPLEFIATEFQIKVWKALLTIPYGETRSYKQIAEQVGCPKGARAVGMANNKNEIMIVVPCHRVIGSTGKLIGYAGGLDTKETLLKLERNNIDKN